MYFSSKIRVEMTAWKQIQKSLLLCLLVALGITGVANAVQSSSSSYGVDETQFSSGGVLNSCSTTYCTNQTLGELGVGNISSTNGQVLSGGIVTDRQPYIEFVITGPTTIDVGTLTSASTHVASTSFRIKTYLAGGGYKIVNASPGPLNNNYLMHLLNSPTPPSIGNEQFGINLVANSCPSNAPTTGLGSCSGGFGADPVQVPDSSFSNGAVAAGYNTTNSYKYVNGDTIASSSTSSGETDFTVSYMFNISDVTPGGTYIFNHVLVATSTY